MTTPVGGAARLASTDMWNDIGVVGEREKKRDVSVCVCVCERESFGKVGVQL